MLSPLEDPGAEPGARNPEDPVAYGVDVGEEGIPKEIWDRWLRG